MMEPNAWSVISFEKKDKITHVGFIVLSVKMRIFSGKKCIVLNDVPD